MSKIQRQSGAQSWKKIANIGQNIGEDKIKELTSDVSGPSG
jgi:hypothetical protein